MESKEGRDTRALEKYLDTWGPGRTRSRHDYDCPDHLLHEMMHQRYWINVPRLQDGDLIFVTDAANERALIVVDNVDKVKRVTDVTVLEAMKGTAVTRRSWDEVDDRIVVKNFGPRGGFFCIATDEGKKIAVNFKTKADADALLEQMRMKGDMSKSMVPEDHRPS